MKSIQLKKLPTDWHELTLQQIFAVSKLFIHNSGAKDFVVRFFMAITGWKLLHKKEQAEGDKTWFWFGTKGEGKFLVDGDLYTDLVKSMEWILSDIKLISVLPEFGRLKPVDVRLYEVTLDEYLFLDSAFTSFVKSNQVKYLNRMLAIAYRAKGETWNSDLLTSKARRFWLVPFYKKYVIFLWYVGVKAFLKAKYPFVWQKSESGEISHVDAILNLLSSLNNGDVTRNKELFKTHVHEAFYELNLKAEQAEKLKSK